MLATSSVREFSQLPSPHRLSFSTRSRSLVHCRVFVFVLSSSLFAVAGGFVIRSHSFPVAGFRVGWPCIVQFISQVRLCVAQFSEGVGSASCSWKARALLLPAVFEKYVSVTPSRGFVYKLRPDGSKSFEARCSRIGRSGASEPTTIHRAGCIERWFRGRPEGSRR